MTKNRSMKIALLVLALALLTSCFVGSTFAKYTSTSTGTATGYVAKWAFTVDGNDITTESTFTFDLFDTINEIGDTTENEVAADRIAPGTEGSFAFDITNASEVDATFAIDFGVSADAPTNLKFAVVTGAEPVKPDAASFATLTDVTATDIDMNTDAKVTVYWMWAFETGSDDVADTTDGKEAVTANSFTVTAVVTATQKN